MILLQKLIVKDINAMRMSVRFLTIGLMVLTAVFMAEAQNKTFKAGASISNVTPAMGGAIIGGWKSPPADYIHDDLNARSIVLHDGETTLAIVVVDNVHIKREVFDAAKAIIVNRTGIPYANIMMSSTHTHSGVGVDNTESNRKGWQYGEPLDEYQRFMARRIADGVQTAYRNLEPAKIGWGGVDVPDHVFNRRWYMKEEVMNPFGSMDKVKMNPGSVNLDRPSGPIDPEVAFVAVESKDGRPIALLGNYSLHYVGNVPKGSISADYFAIFADRMQELLDADRQDPRFVGIMSNGTSGDINNINFGAERVSQPPYEQMNYVANDVAEKVFKAYQNIKFQDYVSLGAEQSELTLEVRKATPEILKNMELVRAHPVDAKPLFHGHEKIYAERIRIIEEEWPNEIDVVIQTFKIGDLGIAAIPFEAVAAIGLEIKEKSPFDQTFSLGLANGIYGYLPTPEQHKLGGYETWLGTNRVEFHASEKIVTELLNLFSKLD